MSRPSTDTSYQESKLITFPDNSEDRVISDELQPQLPIGEASRPSMQTVSETWSAYHRDTNECTEFCQDCLICFGACEACCPSTGEGCLSSTAAFFGNIMVGFCKC